MLQTCPRAEDRKRVGVWEGEISFDMTGSTRMKSQRAHGTRRSWRRGGLVIGCRCPNLETAALAILDPWP